MLCLGVLNGCGAARPSKFYQLTLPNDKPPARIRPLPGHTALGPITSRICTGRPHRLHLEWRGDGHIRISDGRSRLRK